MGGVASCFFAALDRVTGGLLASLDRFLAARDRVIGPGLSVETSFRPFPYQVVDSFNGRTKLETVKSEC